MADGAFHPTRCPVSVARIALAAVSQTVEEQIMVEPARQEVRIIAQFGDVQEEVIVREATTELVSVLRPLSPCRKKSWFARLRA